MLYLLPIAVFLMVMNFIFYIYCGTLFFNIGLIAPAMMEFLNAFLVFGKKFKCFFGIAKDITFILSVFQLACRLHILVGYGVQS